MNTDTEDAEAEAPDKESGFQFNDKGQCTNPEKVHIRCAPGGACALLLAEVGDCWASGFSLVGRNLAAVSVLPSQFQNPICPDREAALLRAKGEVEEYLQGLRQPEAVAILEGLAKQFPAATAAPDQSTEYQWDERNCCTNPRRAVVEDMPENYACVFLTAQKGNDWFWGYELISPNMPFPPFRLSVVASAEDAKRWGCATENAAISCANGAAQEHLKGYGEREHSDALRALVNFARGRAGIPLMSAGEQSAQATAPAKTAAAPEMTREEVLTELMADGDAEPMLEAVIAFWMKQGRLYKDLWQEYEEVRAMKGRGKRAREMRIRSVREAIAELERGAELAALEAKVGGQYWRAAMGNEYSGQVFLSIRYERIDGHDKVRCARLRDGKIVHFMPLQLFPVQADEHEAAPAAAAKPTSATAAEPVLPGLAHEANEHGVFEKPERVRIPMPKKAACEVRLACSSDGLWAFGYDFTLGHESSSGPAMLEEATFENRTDALEAALCYAQGFFGKRTDTAEKRLGDRCCEAIIRFGNEYHAKQKKKAAVEAGPVIPTVYRTEFAELAIGKIQRNPANHRKHFDAVKLRELADSLKAEGLHQPIAVRKLLEGEQAEGQLPLGDPGAPEYELIFGERRWRAAQIAGMATIQAKLYHGLTRSKAHAIALVENLQREGINAMEEAEGYAALMAEENLTQEQCGDRCGRPRSTVANSLRLLRLPEKIRDNIRDGLLTAEHGKALVRFIPEGMAKSQFPSCDRVVLQMAAIAIRDKTASGYLEKGVPFVFELTQADLAVRIDQWAEHKVPAKLKTHPAYFQSNDGDWVCLEPKHWRGEVEEMERRRKEREEEDQKRRQAEVEKLAKGGRKQLKLDDLDSNDYRQFSDAQEPLLDLVPESKKAAAKGSTGRVTVVTDVQLADRLKSAMQRAIRKNRSDVISSLEEKVKKKLAKLKKVGPREFGWLVFLIADGADRSVSLRLTAEAARAAGVKLPPAVLVTQVGGIHLGAENVDREKRLAALAKCDSAALVRALIMERLAVALREIVEVGPNSVGGQFVRWWLDSDTLWLLEETQEGREELVDQVKHSPWYAKAIAGEDTEGDE